MVKLPQCIFLLRKDKENSIWEIDIFHIKKLKKLLIKLKIKIPLTVYECLTLVFILNASKLSTDYNIQKTELYGTRLK